jgi:hypothetical protein
MPGPRNSKRQKKLKGIKGKKGKETAPIVTVEEEGGGGEKDVVVTADVEQRVEEGSLREPPVYDPGTGPRVRSMGEFLRSSFASEPTWDDELCAEFAQEEMMEMLREILPEEMALVSGQLSGSKTSETKTVGGDE